MIFSFFSFTQDGDYVKPSVALPQMLLFGGLDTEPHVATGISLDGLGRLPRNIPSVASLLLFNTDDTPYQRYMALDNLLGQDRSDEAQMTSAGRHCAFFFLVVS